MKHNLIAASLLLFCTSHTSFSMDREDIELPSMQNKSKTQCSLSDIVDTIDSQINKQYENKKTWFDAYTFSEGYAWNLIGSIKHHCAPLNDDAIDQLCAKNQRFEWSIAFFYRYAENNLTKISPSNILTILDPQQQQPTPELNKLPLSIKTYCMNKALKNIEHTIDINLENNFDQVKWYDVHAGKHLVAASSFYDEKFCLWSLATGKLLWTLPEKAIRSGIFFNHSGNLLMTTSSYQDNPPENHIKIWEIGTQKLLYAIQHKEKISYAQFIENPLVENQCAIAVYGYEKTSLYQLRNNKEPKFLGIGCPLKLFGPKPIYDPYVVSTSINSLLPLRIKKTNCHHFCLCMQAIEKTTQAEALDRFTRVLPQLQLTDYERGIVDKKITEKATALSALIKQANK